ncbi:uncharacterized protein BT62DRAFT_932525 [Guyanagaster necrorhizus]|uniref:Transmembrane protein n=1 Tax=Guyanagaster necrorhizus TaxID=856835 RepID=A0A9P7VTJ0_9AGAR|nr:uncharacterized protein BT62DRAFT_932525 [Guyanagaster necrorhizus MCA 3950]KAG7446160.1 hypothetical protein BT62DRAFT_932525 [Guyanagaster necrorhizus MCA 3950]
MPLDVTIVATPIAVAKGAHLSSFTETALATRMPYRMMKQRPQLSSPPWQQCNMLGRQETTSTNESTWTSITILPTSTTADASSSVTSMTTTSSWTTSSTATASNSNSTSSESFLSTSNASLSSTMLSTTSEPASSTSSYATSTESESPFSTSSSSAVSAPSPTSSSFIFPSSPTSYSWASPSTYWPMPATSWYTVVSTSWVAEPETVTRVSGSSTSARSSQFFASTTTITSTGLLSTNTPDEGNSLSRNTGAIIGIAVAVAVVVMLIAIGAFFACRKYRRSASEPWTKQPQFMPSWRPPLEGDDGSSIGATVTATSTVGHRMSSGQIPYIDPREMGPPSSEGMATSSHGHSSHESSSYALLSRSRSSSVGKHMRAEEAPSEEEESLGRLHARRPLQVSDLVIPPVPRIPSAIQLLPTSPISSASSAYPSSLLNPPPPLPFAPPASAYAVQSSSSWPPPPMQVPSFETRAREGLLHPSVGLEQSESVTSFRDHMDYSRPILPRRIDRGEEDSI